MTSDYELLYIYIGIVSIYIWLELFNRRNSVKVYDKRIDDMIREQSVLDDARIREGRDSLDLSEIILKQYLGERNEKD